MRRQNKAQTTCVTFTDQRKYISIVSAIAKQGIKSSKETLCIPLCRLWAQRENQVKEPHLNFKTD